MIESNKIFILLFTGFALLSSNIFSQDIIERISLTHPVQKDSIKTNAAGKEYNLFWYDVGGGLWLDQNEYTQCHSFSYQFHKNYFVSLQYLIHREDRIYELSVLFGFRTFARFGSASLSAGMGSFKGHYANKDFFTIGFPINVKVFFTPLKFIGIGLSLYGNINPKRSYSGLSINLQIGKLM